MNSPPAFGLTNIGNTCYFNSMIQSLLSCESLTKVMLSMKTDPMYQSNPVAAEYIRFLDGVFNQSGYPVEAGAGNIWRAIVSYLSSLGKHKYFGHGQEDTHESFCMLMECWENLKEVVELFNHIEQVKVFCLSCKGWVLKKESEPTSYFQITPHMQVYISEELKSKVNIKSEELVDPMANVIRKKIAQLDSYICTTCKDNKPKIECTILRFAPKILIVLCNKYEEKIMVNFPERMDIHDYQYRVVSQIIHYGSTGGGHYIARSKRKSGWYELNDSSPSKIDGYHPDQGTYVVFYERD